MKNSLILLTVFIAAGGAAQEPQSQTAFEDGEWETRTEVISLEAPSLPQSVREDLRRTIEAQGGRACMGGSSSNPARDLRDGFVEGFRSVVRDASCSFSGGDTVGNGVIRTQGSCRAPGNGTETSFMINGSYDRTSVDADFAMAVRTIGASEQESLLRARGRTTVRRIGPCRASNG